MMSEHATYKRMPVCGISVMRGTNNPLVRALCTHPVIISLFVRACGLSSAVHAACLVPCVLCVAYTLDVEFTASRQAM